MTAIRQDAWTADDDLILAEVTLRHIREGSTQLAAFEEVGEKIGRTSAACGFRWNSCVRKKYEAAIQLAKAQRQKRNFLKKQPLGAQVASITLNEGEEVTLKSEMITEDSLSMDMVIRYLRQWRNNYQDISRHMKHMEKELQDKEEQCNRLRQENEQLSRQVNAVQTDYRTVNDDYKALIQIMDRARRLAILSEEEEETKTRFRMDANGNLERIE
ncbi:RsfA family transcriptional regulator [Paenibacillus apiarius]|uniref:RsfA family transcriptional regulator n=1 Tax=Paenibacillus apiarius TaxID=46240 RepID=A0ABT4DL90_9BACL|nr:RsfA family transcriptional regulator [Paenibacillus apiarius]MCY9513572.1 RsfA family transcriptional regulator [Paenibacillus apiarius]MCY9518123.1 RsfA family transcriptional regulator [Paenibacillus apiarius]MCY9551476.1 RsfA family transcriptional regulator [Paenibacillus apiarius]MCY9558630.1 RsfA family transcriptional regulator [Paenibacillus apiarius]MCY9684056.1 RsfA family transcriptional regulator [Paenibacillus apiarius]